MKIFAMFLAAICIFAFGVYYFALRPDPHLTALMPGQPLVIHNSFPIDLEVHSEYPISLRGQGCFFPRTADVRMECGAGDVTLTDLRPRLLIWGRSNHVNWIVHPHLGIRDRQTEQSYYQAPYAGEGGSPLNQPIQEASPAPYVPQAGSTNRTLLPGETVDLRNTNFRSIHVHAQLPVSVDFGDCHASYVLNWSCSSDPAEIQIRDDRSPTRYTPMTGNAVVIEAN